jgi:E3 ubiquitin-protein ligase TRIP12
LIPNVEEDNFSWSAAKKRMTDIMGIHRKFVQAPLGLFPHPFFSNMDSSNESEFSKLINNFCLLEHLTKKILQYGKLLDLPLSTIFYKLVLGYELDLHDIQSFDLQLGYFARN